MSDYILSIGAGTNQLPLILAIKQMGYLAIACDLNPAAPGAVVADEFINLSTYEAAPIIEELKQRQLVPVAVLTRSTGIPVVTTAIIASALGLPGMSPEHSKTISHKQQLIATLQALHVASPAQYQKTQPYPLPVFVKPANTIYSHAAMGKCTTMAEVEQMFQAAKKISSDGTVNIEEYLIGYDMVSIDFVYQGNIVHLCTVGEISTGAPKFDGLGWYTVPTSWDAIAAKLFSEMQQALCLHHGFFQTAMKYNPTTGKAKIYEVHGEIGGDCVNDVYIPAHLPEYDVFANNIRLALGLSPMLPSYPARPCLLIFKDKIEQYQINVAPEADSRLVDTDTYQLQLFATIEALQQALARLSGPHFSIVED